MSRFMVELPEKRRFAPANRALAIARSPREMASCHRLCVARQIERIDHRRRPDVAGNLILALIARTLLCVVRERLDDAPW
jgi:hypothetical protein